MKVSMRLVAVFCALCLAVSCGSGNSTSATRPTSKASISIASPKANAVISGKTFEVRIALRGGRIVRQTSKNLNATDGHVHVSIDGAVLTMTYGLAQKVKTPSAGSHLLQVEFVAKDHGPFDPRVIASVPFEVRK